MQRLPLGIMRTSFGLLIVASIFSLSIGQAAFAGILPLGAEQAEWSDMAFPSGVSGSYNSGSMTFIASASPSNSLEIGSQFGPGGSSLHYGTGGTLGGPFAATLSVAGVVIQPDGTVTNGGTVRITYESPVNVAGHMADDYANTIHAGPLVNDTNGGANTSTDGDALLEGSVLEVLLNATGDNTLDVLFSISGGALQYVNPALGENFSLPGIGLIRLAGTNLVLPSDWSGNFSFSGSGVTINVFGIPEPSSLLLGLLGAMLVFAGRSRR